MVQNEVSMAFNDHICEAEGCFAVAEGEIKVPLGQIGEIKLSICNNCKPKFISNCLSGYDGNRKKRKTRGHGYHQGPEYAIQR